jgi:hypothetical protein
MASGFSHMSPDAGVVEILQNPAAFENLAFAANP